MIYRFDTYHLDTSRYELCYAGVPQHVEPKVFDLLQYLIERQDQVVSKDDLYEHLWPNQFISDSALTYYMAMARKAIGDNGREQRLIKTIHGRGYSFIASVETTPAGSGPGSQSLQEPDSALLTSASAAFSSAESATPPLHGRRQVTAMWCRIAVTPLSSTGLDPEERHDIVHQVQTICHDVARQSEGYIEQQLSHGLLCYFGYPPGA